MTEKGALAAECPPDTAFVALLDGRLGQPEVERLHRHAEFCASCRALLGGLVSCAPLPRAPDPSTTGQAVARSLAGGLAGTTLGRKYRLSQRIGEGGMGAVYEAVHAETGRRVAIKVIHDRLLARDDEARRRFKREARFGGSIRSPHIVDILDAGEDEEAGRLYLVMEHLRGEDLQGLIDRVGALPPDVALRVVAQALTGLVAAHAGGVLHRDIKPANLFLSEGEGGRITVKLLDFGIAKLCGASAPATALTVADALLGSPLYMSPEQAQAQPDVDERADVWSIGSVLYCALAGTAPFAHIEAVFKVITAICSSAPPPLRRLAPWVPKPVVKVVDRALSAAPKDRHPSAAAMLDAISRLLPTGTEIRREMLVGLAREARIRGASILGGRPRLLLVSAAVGLLFLLAGAGFWRAHLGATREASGAVTIRTALPTVDESGPRPRAPEEPSVPKAPRSSAAVPPPPAPVALRISPKDATVEVDGVAAEVRGGTVEIPGALGSSHRVRVVKGRSERVEPVFVTDKGAIPPQVDLVVGRPPPPSDAARAASLAASAHPPASDGGPQPIEEEERR